MFSRVSCTYFQRKVFFCGAIHVCLVLTRVTFLNLDVMTQSRQHMCPLHDFLAKYFAIGNDLLMLILLPNIWFVTSLHVSRASKPIVAP